MSDLLAESCSIAWRPYCSCRWGKDPDKKFGSKEGSTMEEQNAEQAAGQTDRISQHDAAQQSGQAPEPDVVAPEPDESAADETADKSTTDDDSDDAS